jgi:hypothetical protein
VAETVADPIAQFKAKETLLTPANLISFMRAMMVFPAIFALMAHLNILAHGASQYSRRIDLRYGVYQ